MIWPSVRPYTLTSHLAMQKCYFSHIKCKLVGNRVDVMRYFKDFNSILVLQFYIEYFSSMRPKPCQYVMFQPVGNGREKAHFLTMSSWNSTHHFSSHPSELKSHVWLYQPAKEDVRSLKVDCHTPIQDTGLILEQRIVMGDHQYYLTE